MEQDIKVDSVRSQSSGVIGRSRSRVRDATLTLDSSSRPQPDGFTNSEGFLAGVSSCGVTMIEMHAEESGIPLKGINVTIKGSRHTDVTRYESVHMHFELIGVTQAQAEELVRMYQGRCPLYGTLAVAAKMAVDVTVVHADEKQASAA
jgi:uncharacterized OsmC-like protein